MTGNWRFWHCGIVVKDIDKASDYYQSLGIGPFGPPEGVSKGKDIMMCGKPADYTNLVRITPLRPVHLELIQPVSGHSVNREYLERHGEGISHMAFFVDDLASETNMLLERGFNVLSSGRYVEGGGYAYFDTDRIGGVLFELVQMPPGAVYPE